MAGEGGRGGRGWEKTFTDEDGVKKKKKTFRVTRRHCDIFWILADTLLMCDSEGQMEKAEGEVHVKAAERMDRGIEELVEGRINEKVGE